MHLDDQCQNCIFLMTSENNIQRKPYKKSKCSEILRLCQIKKDNVTEK